MCYYGRSRSRRVARGYRRKRSYTTPQRILVHLSVSPFPPESTSIASLTQEGIAASTRSARTTVTKWLNRLLEQGLLHANREHVSGHRVRKTVYRLTADGWERARSLHARLEADVVHVAAPGVGIVPMRIVDVPRVLPSLVDLTSAVSLVREGNLDLTRPSIGPPGRAGLLWGDGLRTVDRVFGRTEETRTLDRWASSDSPALAVVGDAGIGKSTLVASWVLRRRPRPHVFWLEPEDSMSPRSVLVDIAAFLERLGRRGLVIYLEEGGAVDSPAATGIVAEALRDLPALFVFDNVHRAHRATRRFLTGPLLQAVDGSPAKVILVARPSPSGTPSRASRTGRVPTVRVGGLDLEASMALLRSKGLAADDATARRIAASARGHPLLLGLAAQSGAAVSGEVRHFLDREVWRTLSAGERAVLEAAAVFRGAAPVAALRTFPGVTESALSGLDRKDLLRPTLTERVVVHDEIRDYVRRRLGEAERRGAHMQAASYFRGRLEPFERIEAIHHLVRAGALAEAADMLETEATSLVDSLNSDALASVLSEADPRGLEPRVAAVLAEAHGDALSASGRLGPAEEQYRLAIESAERAGPERGPRLLRKIASIARTRNEYERAFALLAEARAGLASHPSRAELAEVLKETALVEQARGRLEDAMTHLNEAIDLATEVGDSGSLARSLSVLGSFSCVRGDPELGLREKLEGLRIAERAGNLTEAARACISVGTTLWELRRVEEGLSYHDRGLRLATLVGNLRLIAYAGFNRAAALLDLGRVDEARQPLARARQLFEILGERDALAVLEVSEGHLANKDGRWPEATKHWAHAVETLREIGTPVDLLHALREIGHYHRDHGDPSRARAHYAEALRLARRVGNDGVATDLVRFLRETDGGSPGDSR